MRTALTRRTSAIALAGVLALAGAACESDSGDTGTDVNVTETEDTLDTGSTETDDAVDTGSTETDDADLTDEGAAEGETETGLGTETETSS